ncbi:hypothetical protein J1614_006793 [Plenodomus biglobosus]|nr:hypothetical protein J1614_006793 [Plenodomus biglobosus]
MNVGQYPAAPRTAAPPATVPGPAARAPSIAPSTAAAPTVPTSAPAAAPASSIRSADLESNATIKPPRRGAALMPGFRSRPPFRTWLRGNWLDLITILSCDLAALLIYLFVSPILPRLFPLYPGIETSAWGRRYGQPLRPEYVTTLVSALVSYLVPAAIMGAIALWRTRDFGDGNAALLGLGYALATGALFSVLIKVFIGGLRPHFLDICRPSLPSTLTYSQAGSVCTRGTRRALRDAQMSFPSGHAVAAFAGFGFLALYINAKYKVFGHGRRSGLGDDNATVVNPVQYADTTPATSTSTAAAAASSSSTDPATTVPEKPTTATAPPTTAATDPIPPPPSRTGRIQHWKLMLFTLPWLVASILSLSKIRDGWHHPVDILVGALIGSAFAHMAFRMVYRSVYDERDNHVPREQESGMKGGKGAE